MYLKNLLASLLISVQTFFFGAAEVEQGPTDSTVRTEMQMGELDNGLRYYIQGNGFPKDQACLRLIVKAGSIHEEEHQQGLAHFLEHMAFRGTEHFADYEIVDYLESIGAQFGPDTNAYTAFDHTHYILNVPTDKEGAVDKGILILSDFAGRALLDDELIEIERGVVCDEYHNAMNNAGGRSMSTLLAHLFGNSIYAERAPIGKKDVILNCDPQAIKDFYKRWYRPDRMAVVAIGAIDPDEVEVLIHQYFSDLSPAEEEMPEEPEIQQEDLAHGDFLALADKEFPFVQGALCNLKPYRASEDANVRIEESLLNTLFTSILNTRLQEAGQENPAPFLGASGGSHPITQDYVISQFIFTAVEGDPASGLKRLCRGCVS